MIYAALVRVVRVAGTVVLAMYFVFCTLFLVLRYGVLPNIDHYKPRVEQLASHAIGQSVSIARIRASWFHLTPRLELGDVAIRDRAGRVALRLPKVSAAFSWWSAVVGELRLDALEIERPDLDILREADGRIFVAGIFIDTSKSGDGRSVDWVLSQHRIVIRDGRLRWTDRLRHAPELALEHVDVRLENRWQQHAFALTATPPAALAAPLDLRGIFHHPRFSKKVSDVSQWSGTLYADVRSPDLSAWGAYVRLPMALEAGSGAVRSWLMFDREKVVDLTADLHLAGVSTRLAPELPLLQLVSVDGRIALQEGLGSSTGFALPGGIRLPSLLPGVAAPVAATAGQVQGATGALAGFGSNGHTIALTNFSMQTNDGLRLPLTTITERYIPATPGHPEQAAFSAQVLDLQTLANFVERLPLPAAQRRMLQDFSPHGTLRDFSASWRGTYPEIASYAVKGSFSNLSLQAQAARASRPKTAATPAQAAVPAIPGFDNLSGSVNATERGGAFVLAASDVKLHLPGYFATPVMPFDRLDMNATWAFEKDDQLLLQVGRLQFARQGLRANLSGRHLMPLAGQRGKPLGSIDLSGTFTGLDIAKIDEYLPLATPEHLRAWINGALVGGVLQNATLKLKGDLAAFPFHPVNVAGAPARPAGEFRVAAQIENGKLDVAPGRLAKDGKAPLWPLIDAIQGSLLLDRGRMEIEARSARTRNVALSSVKAVIPDLLAPDKILAIDGNASGALQELLGFVGDSPVIDWIGRFTEESRASGSATLGLKLQLPLARMAESKVQGVLQMAGNDVSLQPAIPTLFQTSGKLEFNEKGVTLNGVKASFVGGPVLASGGSQKDGAIVIKAEGSVSADGLRRAYAAPAIQRLAEHVSGSTRYSATIAVRRKKLELLVDSSLQGVTLDFPAPLRKGAGEVLPLKLEIIGMPGDETTLLHDEIRIALGSALSARYQRQKSLDRNAAWRVLRGGIGVNVPAPQPDSGVSANISLKSLNIDAWRVLIAAIVGADRAPVPVVTAAIAPAGAGAALPAPAVVQSAPDAADGGLSQYIEPEVLAARAVELIIGGKKLDNVVVGVSHLKGTWQANIDAAQASGYVTWNEARPGQGLGRVTARLSSLIIPKTAASDVTEILEGKNTTTQIPALDIVADNFELFGKKLGRVELLASEARNAGLREWRINKLLLTNSDAELKATGNWSRPAGGDSVTNLGYRLSIANAGKLLERFGFANVLRGGKGNMEGDVSWNGLPFSLDVPTLSGEMRIDVAAGQFLKVDPGAAKLLGVLSLQSLPRRLTLDFRDVFSEGFAFDGITGNVVIAQGVAKTDNLKMRSINATVVMDGSADIARETQNLHVAVIPEINVGTASVVYALAINPVIGLGSFLAQLFLRDPLMRAFTFEYKITGPWTAPQVVKVNRNGSETPIAPGAPAPSSVAPGSLESISWFNSAG